MASRESEAERIFLDAVEHHAPPQWGEYVQQAAAGDPALVERVEALLRGHGQANPMLDECRLLEGSPLVMPGPTPGTIIGPYKLLEQIGEGGMGLVFMADQTRPVRRRVALKVLKPGMDTRQVVARFEAERQALAIMDHPHIARVFDAGVTESGRPYFVMELVRGVPITEYCDERRLTTRQRLELFVAVCQAVQHAHQKGVIHRDLKPSNVLVTQHDNVAVPKVIDFGIAKATTGPLTERTLFTNFAQMLGTPLYMSPEQAEMSGLDVDTRSDVYSLGVMLYELLTGTTPFEADTLKKADLDEMRRLIREEEPPTPSRRLSTLSAQACSTMSERRGVDGRRLAQVVRGELDWIVMKALEKDRNRRYESASAFAADVQRYLNDEAVEACPPSVGYRLRKHVRRNRRALITVGMVAVALVTATAVSTWQAIEANSARQLADQRLEKEKEARTEAAAKAAVAWAVNDFLQNDLLRQVNRSPQGDDAFERNPNLTVREALDRAAARIGERFRNQPLVEAAIRLTIGEAYESLDLDQLAVPHLEKAVALRRAGLGTDHPETLDSLRTLAGAYGLVGRSRDAVTLLEDVLDKCQRLFGSDHPTTLDAMRRLAEACRQDGRWDRSILLAKQVVDKRTTELGSTHDATVGAMHLLARCYLDAGCYEESIAWHEKVLQTTQNHNLWAMKSYSWALQGAGRLEEADCVLRKNLELARKLTDRKAREHEIVLVERILGLNLLLQGRYPEAESVAREALAHLENRPPGSWDYWSVFHAMSLVGGSLLGQKRYAEAEPFLVRGYEGLRESEALINPGFNRWLRHAGDRLACYYEATNQPEKARRLREELRSSPRTQ
jgi:serine/threonine protein kinase/tetratricopeptide (TPR) repeat protein